MPERMYKVKLIFISLTWVWLKFNIQRKNHARTHVQSQSKILDFDLSLTKILYPISKQCRQEDKSQSAMALSPLKVDGGVGLSSTWVWLKFSIQRENKSKNTCTKSNSLHLNLIWVWLKFYTQPTTNACTHVQSRTHFLSLPWVWLRCKTNAGIHV